MGREKDVPHYGLKEHAAVAINHGFILATTMKPASVNDTNYLSYCTAYSRHTKQPIEKVFADKGYAGKPNRDFLAENNIADGIKRKDSTTAKLTGLKIEGNKTISKVRYIFEQYFGISHQKDNAKRAKVPADFQKPNRSLVPPGCLQYRKGAKNPKTSHSAGGLVRQEGNFWGEHLKINILKC